MYAGYGYFNNGEVWNNQRVVAYLNGDPFAGIPGLALPSTVVSANCGCDATPLYCEQGSGANGAFLSPKLDNAPWYDMDVPDSADFAGLFVTEVTGFDSTVRRDFAEGTISGGSLGPMRLGGRCMTVTGWLMAKTCCAAEYGLRWLQESLMGNNFCDDCGYSDLYMIKCCPPDGDTCYLREDGATNTVPNTNVGFSVTDNGGGLYTFFIDDALQANLISYALDPPNNTDGAIPTCHTAGNSFRFVLADALGAIFTFFIPFEAITSFTTAPSGVGASATFTINTNVVGTCDDVVRSIERFVSQVTEYLSVYNSGLLIATNSPTQVRCFETVDGYNPNDYTRLLHRVGLTDGPKVIERRGTCCSNDCGCVNLKVQFTLCSEFPYIFSDIDWCIEEETFDFDECYCLDLRKLCNTCSTQDATKFVEVEVARKPCGIDVLHDGSWCPVGWDTAEDGCPPNDCYLDVNSVVAYDPAENTECTGSATDDTPCLIALYEDFSWTPVNFTIGERGFPPEFCDLGILFGDTCGDCPDTKDEIVKVTVDAGSGTWSITVTANGVTDTTVPLAWDINFLALSFALANLSNLTAFDFSITGGPGDPGGNNPYEITFNVASLGDVPTVGVTDISLGGGAGTVVSEVTSEGCLADNHNCLIRVTYNTGTGEQTWEPINWSGTLPAFPECDCVQIAEVCVITDDAACPTPAADCPINVICDNDYRPDECTSRQAAASFFYRYNGSPAYVPPASPTFTDVQPDHPFYLEIEWVNAQGIITGVGGGNFGPGQLFSRGEMAVALYVDAGSPAFVPPLVPTFTDVPLAHPQYLEIEWSYDEALFFGYGDGTFRSQNCLSRRSAAIVFYRYADAKPTWSDVPCDHPFYTEIEWNKDQGIFKGYGDGTFQPGNDLPRRIAALNFYRAAGLPAFVPPGVPTFLDVPLTDPEYLEIEWCYAQGIFDGFPGPNFLPDTDLSRQAAAVAFYRYNGSPPFIPPGVPTFTDVPLIHPFFLEIEWCYSQGIVTGFPDGSFQPGAATTRQAMATFFYRNAGSPPFSPACYTPTLPPYFNDVPESDANFQQIEWMFDQGITVGFLNSTTWEPIGWTHDPDGLFPPENCNIFVGKVNGEDQDLSPLRELIEVPYDEFVPDCGPFPVAPPPALTFETLCYCEPWEQARKCCTFNNPADWNEATSYVEIWTGSEEMRNLKIEAYRNPFGEKVPCPCDPDDEFWECRDPCATILVPQLPARAKLIIDSRQRIAQLVLSSGRTVNALRYIFSGDGKPFEWFDIGQCSTFCIIVQADCRQTAADATVSIGAVGRFTASGW